MRETFLLPAARSGWIWCVTWDAGDVAASRPLNQLTCYRLNWMITP